MKKASQSILFLLTLIIFFLVGISASQPANPIYKKNGKEYGKIRSAFFRHRWWNYYERGLSFAEGEFYKEALADLKEAID